MRSRICFYFCLLSFTSLHNSASSKGVVYCQQAVDVSPRDRWDKAIRTAGFWRSGEVGSQAGENDVGHVGRAHNDNESWGGRGESGRSGTRKARSYSRRYHKAADHYVSCPPPLFFGHHASLSIRRTKPTVKSCDREIYRGVSS